MSSLPNNELFQLPASLLDQLKKLRRHLARIKIGQVALIGFALMMTAVIAMFIADRLNETNTAVRVSLFLLTAVAIGSIPVAAFHWYWKLRNAYSVARWLRKQDKSIGDRLMGAVELSQSAAEQGRSPRLVLAAMKQVADVTSSRDLTALVSQRLYRWAMRLAIVSAVCVAILLCVVPSGVSNALWRLSMPWRSIPRYTFTAITPLPDVLAVPFGEPYSMNAILQPNSSWNPQHAEAVIRDSQNSTYLKTQASSLSDQGFQFDFPSETTAKVITLIIGDYRQSIEVVPTHRPEILDVQAEVNLPGYLQRSSSLLTIDARRGSIDVLEGSTVQLLATVNREIATGHIHQAGASESISVEIQGNRMKTGPFLATEVPRDFTWTWTDEQGFEGRRPLAIQYVPIVDGPPQSNLIGLAPQQVLLNSEQIDFQSDAIDDFGIKTMGVEWRIVRSDATPQIQGDVNTEILDKSGDLILRSGDPQANSLDAIAAIRAKDLFQDTMMESGLVELRAWAEDYYPNRPRSYSAVVKLIVLTPDQHALWITNQLNQWQRMALDVRDRELQNFEKNKQLHQAAVDGTNSGDLLAQLKNQSDEETANAKRMETLASKGEELLKLAAKNEAVAVGHLERWAQMQQVIDSLAKKKMPQVADLLKAASDQPPGKSLALKTQESSLHPDSPPEESSKESPPNEAPKTPKISLPQTTILGPTQKPEANPEKVNRDLPQTMTAEAIAAQEALLAEFETLADQMNAILANLEASTFVKRLKAGSRAQEQVAGSIRKTLAAKYSSSIDPSTRDSRPQGASFEQGLSSSSNQAKANGQDLSNIADDMEAFFQRRKTDGLRLVLNEIRTSKAVVAINRLANDIPTEQGMSIAQAEFWSDTMDRWAEELVDPACKGNCPGSKSSDSLPPSVVLEALRLLEGQVNLREKTRVAQQRASAISKEDRKQEGVQLSVVQDELDDKSDAILRMISELPEAASKFEKEIQLFEQIDGWMVDSGNRLRVPDTGPEEMAVQTEIIEALLKSKRINPKGSGGGSGGSPGGGGQGEAADSALALLGIGTNHHEVREKREVEQSTGTSGNVLPEEYRKGLDKYFEQLDQHIRLEGGE